MTTTPQDVDHWVPARSRPDTDRVTRLGATQMGEEEVAAVREVINRQVLYRYHGHAVADLERQFAEQVVLGRACLAVNSGGSALQLALGALDYDDGFEVLVPVWGFVSAATAVVATGGSPRFVPVDRSLGIDAAAAAALVTPATRAVLAVHPYGAACDLSAVVDLADRFGLDLVEDVAQACGATFDGQPLGTFGRVAAFSFQHFKLLTSGEGGMVVSGDEQASGRARLMHDAAYYWVDRELALRVPRVRIPPGNQRMSELEGAIGLVQLGRLAGWVERLRALKAPIIESLTEFADVQVRPLADAAGEVATSVVFYCRDPSSAVRAVAGLRAEGVGAGLLLGEPGTNRHFAGDWAHVLRQCGAEPAPAELVASARAMLEPAVVIPIDLRYDQRDVTETVTALRRVLSS